MQPLSGGAGLFFYPVLRVGVARPAKTGVFARAVKRPVKTEDLRFARIGKGSKEYLGRLIDEQK